MGRTALRALGREVQACSSCPRLAEYLAECRSLHPDYWAKPVPGFGDPGARLVIAGLAPGYHGANRSGRPFWLDASGDHVALEGMDAGVSFRSVHDPRSDLTHTVISNTTDGAWPLARLLRERFEG